MKPARRTERARRRAESTLDRLEALARRGRLTGDDFLLALPSIRDYVASQGQRRLPDERGLSAHRAPRESVLARTKWLAVHLGLGDAWAETIEREDP